MPTIGPWSNTLRDLLQPALFPPRSTVKETCWFPHFGEALLPSPLSWNWWTWWSPTADNWAKNTFSLLLLLHSYLLSVIWYISLTEIIRAWAHGWCLAALLYCAWHTGALLCTAWCNAGCCRDKRQDRAEGLLEWSPVKVQFRSASKTTRVPPPNKDPAIARIQISMTSSSILLCHCGTLRLETFLSLWRILQDRREMTRSFQGAVSILHA